MWQIVIGGEEQAEGCFLAERQGSIPFRVASLDLDGFPSIDQFNARAFGVPELGGNQAGSIEGCLVPSSGGLGPSQLAGSTRGQVEFNHQRRLWPGPRKRATGQEEKRHQSARLPD